jgi:hypothetical protein
MSWSTPYTAAASEVIPAEIWNSMLGDNMNEQAVAKARQPNAYFVSTGPNALEPRRLTEESTAAKITTTSTTFVDINGPWADVEHSGTILVWFGARIDTTAGTACVSPTVVGQVDASPDWGLRSGGAVASLLRDGCTHLFTGLEPGTDTVRLEYSTTSGTATFGQRRMVIMPY